MCRGNVYDKHVMSGPTYLSIPGSDVTASQSGGDGQGKEIFSARHSVTWDYNTRSYVFVCLCIRELACGKDFVNSQITLWEIQKKEIRMLEW